MTLQADLDALYGVAPAEFTARRKELVAAARTSGDAERAAVIAAARRPTAAAWVVNRLVRADPTATPRLGELTARLRAAHAAMDGARVRELSTAQRALVNELVHAGFAAAAVSAPTAALRAEVTNTLQAAVADPEVAARLGRLEKAEHWSGFGDVGASAEVDSAHVTARSAPRVSRAELRAAEKRRATAEAAVTDLTAQLATARRRYERQLEALATAEHVVNEAVERLRDANSELAETDSALSTLRGGSPT